jgi:hypothetical protein
MDLIDPTDLAGSDAGRNGVTMVSKGRRPWRSRRSRTIATWCKCFEIGA